MPIKLADDAIRVGSVAYRRAISAANSVGYGASAPRTIMN
jgi:hypothetical protein